MSQEPADLMGKAFGDEIRRRREALGLSQERLGGRAGTTKETIRSVENGRIPKVPLVYALAQALETHLWDLLPPDAEGFQQGPVQDGDGPRPGSRWAPGESNPEPTGRESVALEIIETAKTGFARVA